MYRYFHKQAIKALTPLVKDRNSVKEYLFDSNYVLKIVGMKKRFFLLFFFFGKIFKKLKITKIFIKLNKYSSYILEVYK